MTMVDVVLVVLRGLPLDVTLEESLGVAYLAAAMRAQSLVVEVLDAPGMDLDHEAVFHRIVEARPVLVGFSTTFANISASLDMATRLKGAGCAAVVALGGHQVLTTAAAILEHESAIDLVFVGEAEETLTETVRWIRAGHTIAELELPGVHHRWRAQMPGIGITRDLARPPARDVLEHRRSKERFPIAFVASSRGCNANCTFCSDPLIHRLSGMGWRPRDMEHVQRELEDLVARFGLRYVVFSDDDLVGSVPIGIARLRRLADTFHRFRPKVFFRFSTRANTVLAIPPEDWKHIRGAGLDRIYVGIESGAPEDLVLYQKGVQVEKNLETLGYLDALGISVQVGFIMFNPYSTFDTVLANCSFLERSGQAVFFKNFCQQYEAFPGTALAERVVADGLCAKPDRFYRDSAYRFATPAIGRLAEWLQALQPSWRQLDRALFKVRFSLPRFQATRTGDCAPFAASIGRMLPLIRELNVQTVLAGIHAAQQGAPWPETSTARGRAVELASEAYGLLSHVSRLVPEFRAFDECCKE